ncbi:glycosyltransferase family 4 protein [Pseudomonadales bacterium]|nr:glycosyltransferase family 4 protein [Pseudomonadales bacterium]
MVNSDSPDLPSLTILRVTNLPTDTKNPGRHSELLAKLAGCETTFVTDVALGTTRLATQGEEVITLPLARRRVLSLLRVAYLILKKRPKIVAIHLYWFIPLAFLRIGPRYVYHIHGLDQKLFHNRIINFFWFSVFDKIFSVTPLEDKRIIYIPNPAYSEVVDAAKKFEYIKKTNTISFVGRLDKNKNCDFAIKVFEASKLADSGYKFLVIGDGEQFKSLKTRYGEVKGVVFCGRLPYEKVLETLALSRVLVMSSYSEGYPKVAIEANQLRANVLSPRYPCFMESKNPFFYDDFNVDEIANLLIDAAESPWMMIESVSEKDVLMNYQAHYL